MNVADSDYIAGLLEEKGYTKTEEPSLADIIIINTCTVRQHAEDRAFSYLGTLRKLKDKKLSLKIYLAGCAASLYKDEKEFLSLKKRFPHLDEIIPADEIETLNEKLTRTLTTEISSSQSSTNPRSLQPCEFVTISRGCSNYCSYCIVPYVRGPLIPRSTEEIIQETIYLTKHGINEITLLGQNVNSYNYKGIGLADLLKKVSAIDEVKSIGFLTSHPRDMSDEIIETISSMPKVRKNFHLPLQSGSDRILQLMNRGYTSQQYINLVGKIRKLIPPAVITTDIIVGFPTETEEDFEKTLSLVKEINFENFFAFKYSPRKGTAAHKTMPDDIPVKIKEERLNRLLELLKKQKRHLTTNES